MKGSSLTTIPFDSRIQEKETNSWLIQRKQMVTSSTDFAHLEKVAVIGFGLMGAQISQVFAQNGQFDIAAYDVSAGQLMYGIDLIKKGKYGLEASVARGRLSSDAPTSILSRISTTTSLKNALEGADFVLEAAFEVLATKQRIMKKAVDYSSPEAVLASNTSTLSISKIASELPAEARKRTVGMHFFNPPQIMKLVEVVKHSETDEKIVDKVVNLSKSLGKTPIVVNDIPGFVANRIGISVFAEASMFLEKGISSARDIDLAMRLGYGYPMGPFELGDLVGLDARLRNMEALFSETHEEKFRPPPILKKLVAEGYIGDPKLKKGSRGGYYEYFGLKRPSEEEK